MVFPSWMEGTEEVLEVRDDLAVVDERVGNEER